MFVCLGGQSDEKVTWTDDLKVYVWILDRWMDASGGRMDLYLRVWLSG